MRTPESCRTTGPGETIRGWGGRGGPVRVLLRTCAVWGLLVGAGATRPAAWAEDPPTPKEGDVLPATLEQLEPRLTPRCDLDVPEGGEHVRFVYRAFPRRRYTGGRWIADPDVSAVHLFFTEMDRAGAVRPVPASEMSVAGSPLPPIAPAVRPESVPDPSRAGGGPGPVEWTPSWSVWEGGTLVTFARSPAWDEPLVLEPEDARDADPSNAMPATGVTFGLRARRRGGRRDDVPDVYTASFAFTRTPRPPDFPTPTGVGGAGAPTSRRPAFDLGRDVGGPNTPHWLARIDRPAPPGHDVAFQAPPIVAPLLPVLVEPTKSPAVLVAGGPSVALRVPRVYAGSGYRIHMARTQAALRPEQAGHALWDRSAGPSGVLAVPGISAGPPTGVFFPTQMFETVSLSRAASPAPSVPGELWLVVEHVDAPNQVMSFDPPRIEASPPLRVFLGVSTTDWDGDGAANGVDAEPLDATKR